MLAQAVLAGASGQLRNMATVGGNLLQRTRCLYFQDVTKPCNKRTPGSGCPARAGDHRNLAILGGSPHCVATHPSDMAVALAALDAMVHVEGAAGRRAIPLGGLYLLPGDEPHRETTLERGDLITAVEVPACNWAGNSAYRKVRDRASYAFGVASVAAALDVAGGVVQDVRLALGAVAPVPWRAPPGRTGPGREPPRRSGSAGPPTPNWPRPRRCGTTRSRSRWCATSWSGCSACWPGSRRETPRDRAGGRAGQGHGPRQVRLRASGGRGRLRVGRALGRSPSGLIRSVDASAALALPGVLAVITPDNAPRLPGTGDPELALFQSRAIAYRGQFLAAVVADTLEIGEGGGQAGQDHLRAGSARRDADL